MNVGGFEFEHISEIEPIRDVNGVLKEFLPQGRYRNLRGLPLNKYGAGPFCKFKIPNHFRACGVYLLMIDHELRYVGECASLASRFNAGYGNISPKNCFAGGQETNCRLNNLVWSAAKNGRRISLFFCRATDHKLAE